MLCACFIFAPCLRDRVNGASEMCNHFADAVANAGAIVDVFADDDSHIFDSDTIGQNALQNNELYKAI